MAITKVDIRIQKPGIEPFVLRDVEWYRNSNINEIVLTPEQVRFARQRGFWLVEAIRDPERYDWLEIRPLGWWRRIFARKADRLERFRAVLAYLLETKGSEIEDALRSLDDWR